MLYRHARREVGFSCDPLSPNHRDESLRGVGGVGGMVADYINNFMSLSEFSKKEN